MPNSKVALKVPKRSGFDLSHFNLLTAKVGTLVPILTEEVIPNSTHYLRINLGASMPPLAADTFMKCDVRVEAFFCPMRLCYGGFEGWFSTEAESTISSGSGTPSLVQVKYGFPRFILDGAWLHGSAPEIIEPGSLLDYLGARTVDASGSDQNFVLNPLPLIAYHLIWQEYYRSPLVQNKCFCRPLDSVPILDAPDVGSFILAQFPYIVLSEGRAYNQFRFNEDMNPTATLLADGHDIFSLRQRNFGFDYFTNAQPTAQLGDAMSVDSASSFTISSLRAANSLQMFKERNQLVGSRMVDIVKGRYGANLSDGVAQRPVFLGSCVYNVYNKSMNVTASNENIETNRQNPFNDVAGAVMGNAYASGSDLIIDHFTANEPGYIMVLASLVPTVTYSSGIRRYLTHFVRTQAGSITDMANPLLENTGNQPIFTFELDGVPVWNYVFGYTQRYAEYKHHPDEIHSLFRTGQSLSAFAAQRYIAPDSWPRINSSFLEIPTTYLDRVTAVEGKLSQYGYWLECQFDYKVSMPLSEYSIPSLQDPAYEHGDTVVVHRGGFRF